jgi:hypothetical protein
LVKLSVSTRSQKNFRLSMCIRAVNTIIKESGQLPF